MIAAAAALLIVAATSGGAPAAAEPRLPPPCTEEALAADLTSCDKTIAAEADKRLKARLLFRRGYALNAKQKYDEALRDLNEAVTLDPAYRNAWHERAYTLGELSEFAQAIEDLDREIALRPSAEAYQERSFARHWSGDFAGALADRNREIALRPGDPGPIFARADEAMWLGHFDDARRDLAAAESMARKSGDQDGIEAAEKERLRIALLSSASSDGSAAERCNAADKEGKFDGANLIGDCTAAFLAATDSKAKAALLTIRALAWLIGRHDETSAAVDQRIAVALDPQNAQWHSNLGFSYVQAHHSWAGEREFNKALRIGDNWMAFAGRASARYNLGRKDEAFADAKRSYELHPNDLALTIMGDVAHDRNDDKSARHFWLSAYQMGARDDAMIERLKSIGVDHPENEPKQ